MVLEPLVAECNVFTGRTDQDGFDKMLSGIEEEVWSAVDGSENDMTHPPTWCYLRQLSSCSCDVYSCRKAAVCCFLGPAFKSQ